MKRNLITILTLFSFFSYTKSQVIQGYVKDTSDVGVSGVIIEAISQNDTTKRKDTITDFSGFYEIKDIITGINDIPRFSGDKMTITYDGSQMRINVTSSQDIQNGKLFTADGRTISEARFQKTGTNEFQATMNIPEIPEQAVLFSDGVHPAKKIIPAMLPDYGTQPIEFDKEVEKSRLKSALINEEAYFIFRLDDSQEVDEYQPIEIIKSVDMQNTNYFDFEMQKWPEFFSNLFFNLEDKYGNIQKNTNININSLDGTYSFNVQTNNNGDAQITDISIPHIEGNKLIPDSIDFAVEIPANDYLEMARDTLRKVSNGDLIKNYHNLTPKQQEFFANLYATIVSEQTGNPIQNVLTEMWTENSSDTIKLFSNEQGNVNFENVVIPPFNEITPDTIKQFLRFSGVDLETKLDSINLTNGNFNETYQISEIENPQPKDYTLIINSQDGEGNNLPGVNWLVLSSDSVLMGSGNTGSNSLDTLLFQDLNANKNIILKTNLNEHTDYRLETNLTAQTTETRITENTLLKYLYELGVIGKDNVSGVALDSVDVKAFLNGQLLMNGNSLQDTITNLSTTMPGHNLDLKLLIERAGYIKSDSIPITITEGIANEVIHNLVKETTPENKGVIRTSFMDPLGQLQTTADFIFTNNTLGVADTIFNVANGQLAKDTVLVNETGNTTYNMKIIPHTIEGDIPIYPHEWTVTLTPNQTIYTEPTLTSLEQQQKIKGKVIYGDTKTNATYIDLILRDMSGNTIDSTTTTTGDYEFGPYPIGFQGTLDAHIRNTHPTRADTLYFGHRGIKIVPRGSNTSGINGGPIIMEDKVTNFEDSVKTYNIAMVPAFWIDAETGELAKVNPAHIQKMDGNKTYDIASLREKPINVYFKPTSINNKWFYDMAERIEKNFGIPFAINEVNTSIDGNININSIDTNYLNSIENNTGINAEVSISAGLTFQSGTSSIEELDLHAVKDIRIRGPKSGEQGNSFMIVESERELLGRRFETNEIPNEYYISIINQATPTNMDTTKMVYDHINFGIIHNNRVMRINPDKNERIGNGSWTIRPNENSDFYSTKTQTELYNEERWKAWDSTNIPGFNLKFFE